MRKKRRELNLRLRTLKKGDKLPKAYYQKMAQVRRDQADDQ